MPPKSQATSSKKGKTPTHKENLVQTSPLAKEAELDYDDDDSDADELAIVARQLAEASKKRRKVRRQAQELDLEKATEALSLEMEEAYEKQIELKKYEIGAKYREFQSLIKHITELKERITVEVDELERATLAMDRETMAAVKGKQADLEELMPEQDKD